MATGPAKPLSNAQIARDWGVSKQAVQQGLSKHGKKAADFPTLDDARAWRAVNLPPAPGRQRAKKAVTAAAATGAAAPVADPAARAVTVPPIPSRRVTLDDADGDLDRLVVLQAEAVLQRAFDLFMAATDRGDSLRLAGELRTWADATKAAGAAKTAWLETAQASRKLLTIDEVLSVVLPLLQGIRSGLVKLGDRVAAAANPADPGRAKAAVDAAIDKLFAQVERLPRSIRSELDSRPEEANHGGMQ